MKLLALSLFLVFASCTKPNQNLLTPETALKDFVDTRVGKVIDKDFILQRVTGKLLESFKAMDQAELNQFWDMKNIQSDSFKILEKRCQEKSCTLTYSVGYSTKQQQKVAFISQVQKEALMVQVDEKWLISDVQNVSTYHESLEPINPLQP
jgi:hypothetical protein